MTVFRKLKALGYQMRILAKLSTSRSEAKLSG